MIETARLLLRPPLAQDRDALHAMWADGEVMRDLGPVKSGAQSDAALARHAGYRTRHGLGFFSAVLRDGGEVIGFVGLKPGAPDTPVAHDVEAGWALRRAWWRRGLALEAMAAVLAWGWASTPAPRITAITSARNAASRGLMVRLGMTHLPHADFHHPQFAPGDPLRDGVVYAIARPA